MKFHIPFVIVGMQKQRSITPMNVLVMNLVKQDTGIIYDLVLILTSLSLREHILTAMLIELSDHSQAFCPRREEFDAAEISNYCRTLLVQKTSADNLNMNVIMPMDYEFSFEYLLFLSNLFSLLQTQSWKLECCE